MSTKTFGYEALLKKQRDRNVEMIGRVFRTQLQPKIDAVLKSKTDAGLKPKIEKSGRVLVTVKALEPE